MWREAFWDREKAESISLHDYEVLSVYRGDVIKQSHYYIHPALAISAPKPIKPSSTRTRHYWLDLLQKLPNHRLKGTDR